MSGASEHHKAQAILLDACSEGFVVSSPCGCHTERIQGVGELEFKLILNTHFYPCGSPKEYRVDVGVKGPDGKLAAALEVFYGNKVPTTKAQQIRSEVPMYEFSAGTVLDWVPGTPLHYVAQKGACPACDAACRPQWSLPWSRRGYNRHHAPDGMLTRDQISHRYNISVSTIIKAQSQGRLQADLEHSNAAGHYMFDEKVVRRWLDSRHPIMKLFAKLEEK